MRKGASFTLEAGVLDYVQRTRRGRSRSQRVNELLQRAIEAERREALAQEAQSFFRRPSRADRAETRAFRTAAARPLARD